MKLNKYLYKALSPNHNQNGKTRCPANTFFFSLLSARAAVKILLAISGIFGISLSIHAQAQNGLEPLQVNLTKNIRQIEIKTDSQTIIIERNNDSPHSIEPPFDKTSRPCPPFCIQPVTAAPGVETLGELEMIEFLQKSSTDDRVLIVDTRLSEWYRRETIPLAVNIPAESWTIGLEKLLKERLGAKKTDNQWDYSNAKTLVLFCNGYWNPDSYETIQLLVGAGYPAEKLKWYRGGMQAWQSLGLSTQIPR
ncbi:MAG: rhodanese-like domain-containing protein [Methylohalobius sp. ZOD2]